jgi:hypothetical protein
MRSNEDWIILNTVLYSKLFAFIASTCLSKPCGSFSYVRTKAEQRAFLPGVGGVHSTTAPDPPDRQTVYKP